jgi:hypothetical protein
MIVLLLLAFTYLVIWLIQQWFSKDACIIQSGAYPNSIHVFRATHFFEICVMGQSLTQLLIEIPDDVHFSNKIIVTYSLFESIFDPVGFTSAITSTYAMIWFSQPIPPGAILSVSFQGVRSADRSGRTWAYPIYGRNDAIPFVFLGIARIQRW